jgi:hypothetical protein
VVPFLDFRAAWFQSRGAPARPGEGERPPDGSYAAILSHAGGTTPAQGGQGVNWPIGVSGRVTVDRLPERAGESASGSLDLTLASGEHLVGTFSAEKCQKALAAELAPAAQADDLRGR